MGTIQLVIPMAGKGQRFVDAGYSQLKPLLPIHGIPMISVVVRNLYSSLLSNVILICQRDTFENINLRDSLNWLDIPLTVLCVDEITEGPAETVRVARLAIKENKPLVIANSDQFLACNLDEFYEACLERESGGVVLTMIDSDPKWSYARVDSDNKIIEIREKQVISEHATVGVYGFSSARVAWDAFEKMREVNDRTNGEFYVAPSYNYISDRDSKIVSLGKINEIMHGMGTPEDYRSFLSDPVSLSFISNNF